MSGGTLNQDGHNACRLHPLAMLADQILQTIDRIGLWNIEFHGCLADVKINLSGRATYVAEVRVGHFTRAIHNATHDRNLHTLQMRGRSLDSRRRF